jgi:hypothetical protein
LDDDNFDSLETEWEDIQNGNDPRNKTQHHTITDIETTTDNILIIDTGGGYTSTITSHTCLVLHTTNHTTDFTGYQDKSSPKRLPIVHDATKAYIRGYEHPVILILNYVSLLDDSNERESLLQPFSCMRHGVTMDLTPIQHGGLGGMKIDGQLFAFEYDEEKLFFKITKPTWEDLDYYDCVELTSPYDSFLLESVRSLVAFSDRNYDKITIFS